MSFDRICRLCLRESSALSSLFVDNRAQMLEGLTSIKVCQTDPSVQVCLTCLYNLKLAFEIQQNMKETDDKLKEMWKTNKIEIKREEQNSSDDTVSKSFRNKNSLSKRDSSDNCLICGALIISLDSTEQVPESLPNIKTCDSCNNKVQTIITDHTDHTPTALSGPQARALYQCRICGHPFLHQTVYAVHLKHAHPQDTKKEEEKARAPSPFSDDMGMGGGFGDDDDDVDSLPPSPLPPLPPPEPAPTAAAAAPGQPMKIHKVKQKPTKRPRPFTCNECNKSFTCRKRYETHVHKPPPKKVYRKRPCPICGKEFDTANLSAHISRHNPESHICETCGAKFYNKWNLRSHIYYSHSAYRYKCDRCERVFQKSTQLKLHIKKAHDKNPDFMCDTCGQKFYTRALMNHHVNRIHLKIEPYVCELCRRSFCSRQKLKGHIKKKICCDNKHTERQPPTLWKWT